MYPLSCHDTCKIDAILRICQDDFRWRHILLIPLPTFTMQIALGRSKLEPLAVLSALCGPSAEILSADLHPLKELLPKQALLTAAERVCITAVNQVSCVKLYMSAD